MSSPIAFDSEERQLLLDLRAGDHVAFELLYHRYKRPIIVMMLRMVKSPVLVEELVQELFMKLWDIRETVDPERSVKAYLFQIAANLGKNTLRKAHYERKMRALLDPIDEQVYSQIDDYMTKKENVEVLDRILDRLPQQRQKVYRLCKIDQLSYKEVAAQLGISENAVNDHVKKANAQIRDIILQKESLWVILVFCIHHLKF